MAMSSNRKVSATPGDYFVRVRTSTKGDKVAPFLAGGAALSCAMAIDTLGAAKMIGPTTALARSQRGDGTTVMIKPWIFEFFAAPRDIYEQFDPELSQRYFDAYLDLWASAEPAGFEGIFFSEHHFGAAYSPSPNLLIANVALRTRTLRLGTLGMVLPYHAPWRVVEEIGMLDHLTGGRLEIGTAAGIPNEMAKVGSTMTKPAPEMTRRSTSWTRPFESLSFRTTASSGNSTICA